MCASYTTRANQSGLKCLHSSLAIRLGLGLILFALFNQPSFAQNDACQPTDNESAATKTSAIKMLGDARMIHIHSSTKFFDPFELESELQKQSEFAEWHLLLVDNSEAADIRVEIDRPLFTYTFNYRVIDRKTSVVLATGKITALNGNSAAPKLAREILNQVKGARPPQESKLKAEADFVDKPLTMPTLSKELKKPNSIQQGAREALTKAPFVISRPPAEPHQ